jgi:hypothetical protein
MRYTDFDRFSPHRIRRHASQFATAAFQRRFVAEVARVADPSRADGAVPEEDVRRFLQTDRVSGAVGRP